jgi:hypothetical protein
LCPHSEKVIARRAFDIALNRELDSLIEQAKRRASRISTAKELWEMEHWLTECREGISATYDYRYSALPLVFARLLHERILTENDLAGLSQEKIDLIRRSSAVL